MKKWNLDKVSAGWRHVLCCLVWMLMAAQAVQAQDAVDTCRNGNLALVIE